MLPSSLEVARSLSGSWRMMEEGERAMRSFDLSARGLFKSYATILLAAPAFIALLAAGRMQHGMSNEAGLFENAGLALATLAQPLLSFLVLPALVLALLWNIARTARGTAFVVTWNWTEAIVTMLLAAPAALYAAGFLPPIVAAMFTVAFGLIAARLRFTVARVALGLSAPAALGVMLLTFGVEFSLAWAFALGRF